MAEGTRICLFTVLAVLKVVTVSAQNNYTDLCESPVFPNGMVFEALMENSPENTTIVANMSFAGTAVGNDRTIELTLQDSGDKEWGLLVEELQQLRLSLGGKVLDRDGVSGIRDLRFIVRCKTIATDAMVDNTVIATVLDLNDNEPTFVGAPYNQEVIELTPVGSTIFRRLTADDQDSNENGRVSYQIEGQSDYFDIPLPSTGDIVLKKSLDYEGFQPGEEKKYLIPIVAHDLAANESLRKSSTTTVTIIVTDGDDQAVQFLPCVLQGDICGSPLYVSSVMENMEPQNQPLTFDPAPIFAVDLDIDVQGPPGIVYSFLAGSPSNFGDYFDIDGPTGNITLKRPVERTEVEEFIITVKAEQDDNPLRYATADVKIGVEDDDVNKPYFFISTGESEFKGYVREFTGQAVIVFRYDESPLLLEVKDDDFTDKVVPEGALRYELTDTSGRFDVTDTGYLIVDANQLDIDTQREYRMTVRAVETTTFQKLSTDEATVVVTVLNGTDFRPCSVLSADRCTTEPVPQPPAQQTSNEDKNLLYIIGGILGFLLLVAIVAVIVLGRYVTRARKNRTAYEPKEDKIEPWVDLYSSNVTQFENAAFEQETETPQIAPLEEKDPPYPVIPWTSLTVGETVQEYGSLGRIAEGVVNKEGKEIPAVINILNGGASDQDSRDFMNEIDVMCAVGNNINVIGLIGGCRYNGDLYIAMEHAPFGNLRDFLRDSRKLEEYESIRNGVSHMGSQVEVKRALSSLSAGRLLQISLDIARGMKYLEEQGIIHGYLSAKTTQIGEMWIVKISEFWKAQDEAHNNKRPVRWAALESIKTNRCTHKSDVWSFAVTLHEIVSLGGTPYSDKTAPEVFRDLLDGYRMERQSNCGEELYNMIQRCWLENPDARPTFTEIADTLEGMLKGKVTQYLDMEMTDKFKFADVRPELDDDTVADASITDPSISEVDVMTDDGYEDVSREIRDPVTFI
ncbi:TIE1 [Branchiostoma lanceolatum]|uniref:TIE1 protein n=1 Tax=Branchiostoma lanceolatum TaxID=7740 RepID=A0A8J9Z9H0_BRALA|nr:TIE1 [Branchiostoma lanceolatum]